MELKFFNPKIITYLQILQMIIGTIIVGCTTYFKLFGSKNFKQYECNVDITNIVLGGFMYSGYLWLFLDFFIKRYISKSKLKSKDT